MEISSIENGKAANGVGGASGKEAASDGRMQSTPPGRKTPWVAPSACKKPWEAGLVRRDDSAAMKAASPLMQAATSPLLTGLLSPLLAASASPGLRPGASPLMRASSPPFVPPPPGFSAVEAACDASPPLNPEYNSESVPFDGFDLNIYGMPIPEDGIPENGIPEVGIGASAGKIADRSMKEHSQEGTMTVTALPSEHWKTFFPLSYGGEMRQWDDWEDKEPAVVRASPAYVGAPSAAGGDEASRLVSEHEVLSSENARLAKENEMLRKKNAQLSWGSAPEEGANGSAAYWEALGYPTDMSMLPGGVPPYIQQQWMNIMWAQQQGLGAVPGSRLGTGAQQPKQRAARARTDSDIPQRFSRQDSGGSAKAEQNSPRNRTLSAGEMDGSPGSPQCLPESGPCTTVMLRNLPNNYSRAMLLKLLDGEGFLRQYDFVYLPMDFKSHASLGYAFVNLASSDQAARFWEVFEGFSRWVVPSQKVCSVSWSHPYQGLDAHIERYRNSPVMHEDVPDEYKPMVFKDGERDAFPLATKKLRAPRMRLSSDATGGEGSPGGSIPTVVEEE